MEGEIIVSLDDKSVTAEKEEIAVKKVRGSS
jgi:hypothetical protein